MEKLSIVLWWNSSKFFVLKGESETEIYTKNVDRVKKNLLLHSEFKRGRKSIESESIEKKLISLRFSQPTSIDELEQLYDYVDER